MVPSSGCDLGDDNGLVRVLLVHGLQVCARRVPVGAVVVQAQEIGRIATHTVHEFGDPRLPGWIAGAGRTDEFLALVLAKREHAIEPEVRGMLGRDTSAFGLVEEVDDLLVARFDIVPVGAGELGFETDHGPEGEAVFELGGRPGVPVAEGGDGAVEVDSVEGPGDVGGVGVVPEEAAFLGWHCGGGGMF